MGISTCLVFLTDSRLTLVDVSASKAARSFKSYVTNAIKSSINRHHTKLMHTAGYFVTRIDFVTNVTITAKPV